MFLDQYQMLYCDKMTDITTFVAHSDLSPPICHNMARKMEDVYDVFEFLAIIIHKQDAQKGTSETSIHHID